MAHPMNSTYSQIPRISTDHARNVRLHDEIASRPSAKSQKIRTQRLRRGDGNEDYVKAVTAKARPSQRSQMEDWTLLTSWMLQVFMVLVVSCRSPYLLCIPLTRAVFHHDGPFDACNPHRNRKGTRTAPMQAFPKDSLNMQLGGSGPNNSKLNLDQIHGRGTEAHRDFNHAAVQDAEADYMRRPQPERSASFNPTAQTEPVHGNESVGLGTSTFLEGAPASRAAIQRREIEQEAADQAMAAGLSRKKSLAQRIKSVRPRVNDTGRMTSPEPFPAAGPTSPLATGRSDQSTANPFFKDYDQEYEKKGAQIAFAEEQLKTAPRARAPSSPKRGLTLQRTITGESTGPPREEVKSGGGFLSRVKSIKGPRSKTRERRNTEASS